MNQIHTSTQAQGTKACPVCHDAAPKHHDHKSKTTNERKSTGGPARKELSYDQREHQERGDLKPNAENIRASNLVRYVQCCADMCRKCFADHICFDIGTIYGGDTDDAEEENEVNLEDDEDMPPLEDCPIFDVEVFADADEEEEKEEEEE